MDVQRLRNLTTGKLHTEIGYVYEDLGMLVGDNSIMTHMLPRVLSAVTPWLKANVIDPQFWDGKYDPHHIGVYALPKPTKIEQEEFLKVFLEMPNPFN